MIVHLIDGTYELFRHFYGLRRAKQPAPDPFGAVRGVLQTVLQLIETGATHIGVATDHVIESFRNRLWAEYKTGVGIDPALWAQFHPLEAALAAMGVAVWPMIELEADDALASAAALAAVDPRVEKVCIWTPDKDLAQCVVGQRIVQVDRRSGQIRDADGVRAKFGVAPVSIPDYLAVVGDSADGYPGLPGWGAKSAAAVLARFEHLESIPEDSEQWRAGVLNSANLNRVLRDRWSDALLFRDLATLRADAPLFSNVDALRWTGPTSDFAAVSARLNGAQLLDRATRLAGSKGAPTGIPAD
ncbi:MAG TPA: 5'-3' exonuclease H3TH domain-containing protein [Longimicrobiales bacterium]|nr:5'-3' exonuclease H3TH domain-containing protein [Longimicrobiales bacterium]